MMAVETQPTNTLEAKMESSIERLNVLGSEYAEAAELIGQDWEQALLVLPRDLDESAKISRAVLRRRGIRSAADLLRIIMVYTVCDWSLRLVAAWCVLQGVADISDVAILNRFRHSSTWLGRLIVQMLAQRQIQLPERQVRVYLMDATVISEPGSCGTNWRLHVSLDLGQQWVDGVEVTSAQGGETLARFPSRPGDIRVADRGYAFAKSMGPVLASQAHLVVRINWQNLPLQEGCGQKLDVIAWLRQTCASPELPEQPVWLATPQGRFPLRLVALAIPAEAAARARWRAREAAAKKGHHPDERTLFACGFILVLTNLPASQWSAAEVLALYRLRWQIELQFKRLKSLLNFSNLRAQDPYLAQTYLLGKILALLMLETLTTSVAIQVPDWFSALDHPVSPWRLTMLLWAHLRQIVHGVISWPLEPQHLPRLQRFLCDTPRRRRKQFITARLLITRLSVCQCPSRLC
jgi:hypothetical protein